MFEDKDITGHENYRLQITTEELNTTINNSKIDKAPTQVHIYFQRFNKFYEGFPPKDWLASILIWIEINVKYAFLSIIQLIVNDLETDSHKIYFFAAYAENSLTSIAIDSW